MTKQEEIKEGIADIFEELVPDVEKQFTVGKYLLVAKIMNYLQSQGVVIKVGDDIDIEMTDGAKLPIFAQYESLIKPT